MAKANLGTKRVCPETSKKFYDLEKDPIVSPYTGKEYPLSHFESDANIVAPKAAAAEKAPEKDSVALAENDVAPQQSSEDNPQQAEFNLQESQSTPEAAEQAQNEASDDKAKASTESSADAKQPQKVKQVRQPYAVFNRFERSASHPATRPAELAADFKDVPLVARADADRPVLVKSDKMAVRASATSIASAEPLNPSNKFGQADDNAGQKPQGNDPVQEEFAIGE